MIMIVIAAALLFQLMLFLQVYMHHTATRQSRYEKGIIHKIGIFSD